MNSEQMYFYYIQSFVDLKNYEHLSSSIYLYKMHQDDHQLKQLIFNQISLNLQQPLLLQRNFF